MGYLVHLFDQLVVISIKFTKLGVLGCDETLRFSHAEDIRSEVSS